MSSQLGFKQLDAGSDAATANEVVERLAKTLCEEGLANYLVRRSPEAAAKLWAELLRQALGLGNAAQAPAQAATQPAHPQLHFLSDRTTLAVMQRWPEDRGHWHRSAALLRLAKCAPWGKWRALREAVVALERQKAAFLDSHGPFLYLAAIGTAPEARGRGLGSVLLDHLGRLADGQRRFLYVEASSDRARAWLRRHGFFELLRHSVRPHAPPIYVMVRQPDAAAAAGGGGGGAAAGAGAAAGRGASGRSGGGQQPTRAAAAPADQQLRPTGSVRTR